MTREEAWRRTKGYLYDVLSAEEADEIIKALEQHPCEDCISRPAMLEVQIKYAEHMGATKYWQMRDDIRALPPVTPQPKIGRWIESTGYDDRDRFYRCSECGRNINLICGTTLADYPYCHCGAKMVEPQKARISDE